MHEITYPTLPCCKEDVSISVTRRTRAEYNESRTVLSVSLPIYIKGATPPRPDPSHPLSLVAGVIKRFGYNPPTPDKLLLKKFGRYVDLWLRRNLKPIAGCDLPSIDEWLDSTDYTAERKQQLLDLWRSRDSWEMNALEMSRVKSFIKDETYSEFKYPRLINSRVDLAKCFIGPVVAAISDQVFSMPWFIKKIPVPDRPMAIYNNLFRPGGNYIYTDYTAFEAHFTPEIMRVCQFKLYKYMTRSLDCHDEVMKFCFGTLAGRNRCQFKDVTVGINGVRMSGEMDTSLANGFHNLMAFLFCSWCNNPDAQVAGFVEGDDGIFTVTPNSARPTGQQFSDLGMTIKIGETPHLSEASFCGQVYDVDESIVVADPIDVLCRLGWSNKKYTRANDHTRLQLLRARGYSLVYQYNGCPLLSCFGRRILELTSHVKISDGILKNLDQWERDKLTRALSGLPEEKTPGPNTRNLVEKLYGISLLEQHRIEKILSTCDLGPVDIDVERYAPREWSDYLSHYSHPIFDTNPDWLVRPEGEFCEYLLSKAPQAEKFLNSL